MRNVNEKIIDAYSNNSTAINKLQVILGARPVFI